MDKISDIITSIIGTDGELVEEAQLKIRTAIDDTVNNLVEEQSQLIREQLDTEHEKALHVLIEKNNADHNAKLELLREEMDRSHFEKAEKVFRKLDSSYAKKLNKVREHYEEKLFNEQKEFAAQLVASIDKFLVEEVVGGLVPLEKLEETAKVRHSQKLLAEVRQLIGADSALQDEGIRDAIRDGGNTIKSLRNELSVIKEEKRKLEVGAFLTESTRDLPVAKARFVVESLSGKTLDFAKRNFSFIVGEYERREIDDRNTALKGVNKNSDRMIVESSEEPQKKQELAKPSSLMDQWIRGALAVS